MISNLEDPAHVPDPSNSGASRTETLNTTLLDLEPLRRLLPLAPAAAPPPPMIEFCKPSELRDYQPPEGSMLAGESHIARGAVFVIGGPPGVGKSRVSVALAMAGATGQPWLNLPVPRRFKTLIVQNENGRSRLRNEFSGLPCEEMDAWVRVSPPPPFGLAFDDPEFRQTLGAMLDGFQPDVVMIDPWNAAARDEKARDYLETFNAIRSLMPAGERGPAVGIVAHTRKPTLNERATGRGLLNLLAGSYVLGSVPRSVFILQAATDAPEDDRVVWTCCKNNDGPLGPRTAWLRRDGLFQPNPGFDWETFDHPVNETSQGITWEEMDEVFEQGRRRLARKLAARELAEATGYGNTTCYAALKLEGRFKDHLSEQDGLLGWTP